MNLDAEINLASDHEKARRLAEAEAIYRRIVAQHPNHRGALLGLARIAQLSGRNDIAVPILQRVAQHLPNDAEAHRLLGDALELFGDPSQAMLAFGKAISLDPLNPKSHNGIGNAFAAMFRYLEAERAYRRAIELEPNPSYIQNNLSLVLREVGNIDESIAVLKAAIKAAPDNGIFRNNLATALKSLGRVDEAIVQSREALRLNPYLTSAHSNLLLMLHYRTGPSQSEILEEHRKYAKQHAEVIEPLRVHANSRDPDRKLRIGYVSADFRDHPVGRFLLPLLANHDRQKFEIFCYSDVRVSNEVSNRISKSVDAWRNVVSLTDDQLAVLAHRDGIDILVDLAGHTAGNRLLVFTRKPAPVQITYLGYPDTTGLRTMDYRITDELADPPGATDQFHTEKLIHLPRPAWCFATDLSPVSSERSSDQLTLGCLSHLPKVSDAMLHLWARILRELPGARLSLKSFGLDEPSASKRVRDLLIADGIAAERISIRGLMENYDDHLATYDELDIALDTYPYNGTTTTCEAMWMNVPVVTLAGRTHASRVGVSLLTAVGLKDLIAETEDQYTSIVVGLAKDRSRLGELRRDLREMMRRSPLMDAIGYTRAVDGAYRDAWKRWCATSPR